MAWDQIEIQRLDRLSRHLRESADQIEKLTGDARAAGLSVVALHFREAEKGMEAIRGLVTNAAEHIPDQIECHELGIQPKWHRNLARSASVKAKREAKETTKPALVKSSKKAVKKRES